jgi:hypothetical protein
MPSGPRQRAGSCAWHVIGLQRSMREWRAGGILVSALGVLARHYGYGEYWHPEAEIGVLAKKRLGVAKELDIESAPRADRAPVVQR